ncbi:MAG: oligosaccharide flippase family protein [Parcubacteria group bacterium]|nr:oligosaccharide flippase family protein [Parcubacteria group bacterium]
MITSRLASADFIKKHSSLYEFFIKGEGYWRLSDAIASGLALVSSFLVLSLLSVHEFGLYQLVLAFIGLVGGFIVIDSFDGIVAVEMRHYLNGKRTDLAEGILREYACVKVLVVTMTTAAIFFASDLIARRYGADVSLFVKIASLFLIIDTLQSLANIFLKVIFSFVYFFGAVVREVVKLTLLVGWMFWGKVGIATILMLGIFGWAAALIFTSGYFFKFYRMVFKTPQESDLEKQRFPILAYKQREWYKIKLLLNILKKHGFWTTGRYLFSKATKNTTPWLIKFFINTEAVAIYALAINLVDFVEKFFPMNMLGWIMMLKIDRREELNRIFSKAVKYVVCWGVILGFLSMIFAPFLIRWILPKYESALPLFKFMILALPIFGFYKVMKAQLLVLREYKILALRIVFESVVMVGILVTLLPTIGLIGAAVAYIGVYITRVLFSYPALIRSHPYLRLSFKELASFDKSDKEFLIRFWQQLISIVGSYWTRLRFK